MLDHLIPPLLIAALLTSAALAWLEPEPGARAQHATPAGAVAP